METTSNSPLLPGFAALHTDVIAKGLCARCGLCAGVCPVDVIGFDERCFPRLTGKCTDCGLCNRVCPGADVDLPAMARSVFNVEYDPQDPWALQDAMYVGHPVDDSVRRAGASGGLTTGLLLHLLRSGRIQGAAVVGMDPDKPYQPKSILATTEDEIRAASKSKYCIVPSMDVLAQMRKGTGPYAVVALPCQAHGLRKLAEADKALSGKIAYILGLYCHYNMERDGYLDALRLTGTDPSEIEQFEFRGGGWPGGFFVSLKGGRRKALHEINIKNVMTVMLRLYGAERCFLCTDALAEFADVGLGDFWAIDYPDHLGKKSWCTLVSQRTERGRELLESAQKEGAVELHELPRDRYSKRTRNFTVEKKTEGFVRLRRRARRGRPVPDYHHPIPRPALGGYLMEAIYGSTRILRGARVRRTVLRILFSPFGRVLDHINTVRKRMFLRFHGN